MKKILFIALVLAACIGCKTKIITVDGTKNEEATSFGAFNDERYIWEGWSFSTNRVQTIK